MTVIPGLMDMHVHFGQEYQSKAERPSKIERETGAILAAKHALITLRSGFTTVEASWRQRNGSYIIKRFD